MREIEFPVLIAGLKNKIFFASLEEFVGMTLDDEVPCSELKLHRRIS